jgi:hypothetical protein
MVNDRISKEVQNNPGVRQGCGMSSPVFNMYPDDVLRELKNRIDVEY